MSPLPRKLSPYQLHVAKWKTCQRCCLKDTRRRVVLARGSIPADVLFIGEAPGVSEDIIGLPFIGPAGKLLDHIVEQSVRGYKCCFTNLVGCIPIGDEDVKVAEPPKECIQACWPRLKEITRLVKPRLIVLVGKLAAKNIYGASQFRLDNKPESPEWIAKGSCLEFVEITHPTAILRMEPAQRGLAIQRCLVALEDAIEKLG